MISLTLKDLNIDSKKVQKEIFFHVGLGKTATTYLQHSFFPKLKGIKYIHRSDYPKRYKQLIDESSETRFLCSREFDQQLEKECRDIAKNYPEANIIIVFRSPEKWIASQYHRFAKNGIHESFTEFFDVENDSGKWKREELYFSHKLKLLDEIFPGTKKLVLFHEDLKADSYAFFDKIATFLGATYNQESISLSAVHKKHGDKRLKAMRKMSKYLFPKEPRHYDNDVARWFQWRSRQLLSYLVMYSSVLMPDSWFDDVELIPKEELEKILEFYKEDYEACKAYAAQNG